MSLLRPSAGCAAMILALAVLVMLPARSASASLLQIIAPTPTLLPGQSETVSVQFTSTVNFSLGSADIEIAYDNTRFSVSNVALGTLDPGPGYSITPNGNLGSNPGVVYAEIDASTPLASITTGQVGTLETFTLTALANAPAGGATGDLNLLANQTSGPGVSTAVYDSNFNAIVLTPAPTNGYDVGVDTTVAVVPEPSSLILVGLGGASIAVTSRLRKKARRPAAA
jgi:hypothetical protein